MRIIPFKGFYYNPRIIKDCQDVFCPPYDLIRDEDINLFKNLSPYNIVHIIRRKPYLKEEYKKARQLLKNWIDSGILVRDKDKSFYFCKIEYTRERKKALYGFIGLLDVRNINDLYEHEKTYPGPRRDRLRLLRKARANLSPIYLLSLKDTNPVKKLFDSVGGRRKPLFVSRDCFGAKHSIYKIEFNKMPPRSLKALRDIENNALFVADGHHRLSAFLEYRKSLIKRFGRLRPDHPANFIMCFFSDIHQKGLTLETFFRIIKKKLDFPEILKKSRAYFDVLEFNNSKDFRRYFLNRHYPYIVGCVYKNNYCLFKLKDVSYIEEKYRTAYRVGVIFLHEFFLKKVLRAHLKEEDIDYTPDWSYFLKASRSQVGFIPTMPRKKEILEILKAGILFPHKSTYFFPKLLSGPVIRVWEDGYI